MPLDLPGLTSDLQDLFTSPPATREDCAQAWADAMASYAEGIVPPSAAVAGAAATLAGALVTAFGSAAAAPGMESAFASFAVTVGGGMVGYTPTPPPSPVGFASQFAGGPQPTQAAAADAFANLIHGWLTTGSSVLIAPPNTVTPWT